MKKIIAVAVASGAAALAIVGGAAAANASSGPSTTPHAPNTVVTPVDGAPDLSKVKQGTAVEDGSAPVVVGESGTTATGTTLVEVPGGPALVEVPGGGLSVVEVPGAAPDLSKVKPGVAQELPDEPQVVGGGGKTTARR